MHPAEKGIQMVPRKMRSMITERERTISIINHRHAVLKTVSKRVIHYAGRTYIRDGPERVCGRSKLRRPRDLLVC